MSALDFAWKELAEASRDALEKLGYGIKPRCLPGEIDECGGGYAQHAVSHLAAIKAVADHHLSHAPKLAECMIPDVYEHTLAQVDCREGHQCGWTTD